MKIGQKVYIPHLDLVGTIEEIQGKRVKKVRIGEQIIDVFHVIVKNWDTITKIFTDCSFTTKWLVKTIVEGFARKYQEKSGMSGVFADTVRNGIVDAINSNEVVDALSNKLMKICCKGDRQLAKTGISEISICTRCS